MYAGKVVSYRAIIDMLIRDFGFEAEVRDEECLEWIAGFMAHTNSSQVMKSVIANIKIIDGRGDLPFDLHKINQTAQLVGVETLEEADCGKGRMIPMRWSTDNFHKRYHNDRRDYTCASLSTYTVGENNIYTSFDKGFVSMSYDAIPTDEEGNPTVPAEQQWLEGATHYVAFKIAKRMWMKDQLSDKKFQHIERDRDWYFAQAVNHSKQWNGVDQAESVKNATVRTVPDLQAHNTFFANMQLPEQRIYNPGNNSYSRLH